MKNDTIPVAPFTNEPKIGTYDDNVCNGPNTELTPAIINIAPINLMIHFMNLLPFSMLAIIVAPSSVPSLKYLILVFSLVTYSMIVSPCNLPITVTSLYDAYSKLIRISPTWGFSGSADFII